MARARPAQRIDGEFRDEACNNRRVTGGRDNQAGFLCVLTRRDKQPRRHATRSSNRSRAYSKPLYSNGIMSEAIAMPNGKVR
jgi:hypothetical protein